MRSHNSALENFSLERRLAQKGQQKMVRHFAHRFKKKAGASLGRRCGKYPRAARTVRQVFRLSKNKHLGFRQIRIQTLLDSIGIVCDHAENGQICVEKFEQSEEGWYDLIMMDLRMPVMSGYEAASAIRTP